MTKLPHDHGERSLEILEEMPKFKGFEGVAELVSLLADPKRAQLFWVLCHVEECLVNLSAMMNMSSPALSHHIKTLKNGGLAVSKRVGREVYYTAAKTPRTQVLHELIESVLEVVCPEENERFHEESYDSAVISVKEAREIIAADLSVRHTIKELANKAHLNETTFKEQFKRVYGLPVGEYAQSLRLKKAKELLKETDLSVKEIARLVGYESAAKFTKAFKSRAAALPKDYRKGK